ncbi:unnamed protein product [Penicillium roqueforti FM164]|uniref:Genomic scaffold, ProqFM164S04 n=1 Tax=Penicillium roqueforti (strain FM164) TaxID=1365484 RepID=W6QI91_PENRF|nr:unnamed protein product [Penicillium roqueforti FM164]
MIFAKVDKFSEISDGRISIGQTRAASDLRVGGLLHGIHLSQASAATRCALNSWAHRLGLLQLAPSVRK